MATVDFNGQWKLNRNDENFFQEMGINFVVRKAILMVKPTLTFKQDGDKFEITLHAPMMTKVTCFTVGEEFEYPWEKNVEKVIAQWEDGKLVTKPTVKPDVPTTIREIKDGEMVLTMKKGDLVSVRYFKKIGP